MGSGLKPQLFCDANIIEIRPDGPNWRVGMMTFLAARWLLSATPPTAPDPVGQARQVLGFPPGTRAVQEG